MNNALYIEDFIIIENKNRNKISGDYCQSNRNQDFTDFILCDGMGSGIKANISAISCASRIMKQLSLGFSLHRSCEKAVALMHRARNEDIPFAAFSLVRIMNNGQYTALCYEAPGPILVSRGLAQELSGRHFTMGLEFVAEYTGILHIEESLVLVSDGVTQAGLGNLPGVGWTMNGFEKFINKELSQGKNLKQIAKSAPSKTFALSGGIHADDTTIAVLTARKAEILDILTGPPLNKIDDQKFVNSFLSSIGQKAVCGSSTADIVSRVMCKPLNNLKISTSFVQPPMYSIEGIDIVTEGAVTLNQVYNILDEDPACYDEESCVSQVCKMMQNADIIHFFVGEAVNKEHGNISFKQLGVLTRSKIVPLIAEKLKSMGKIITIERL